APPAARAGALGGAPPHRPRRRLPAGMTDSALRSSASLRRRLTLATALISTAGMLVLIGVVLLVAWRTTDHEMDQVLATRLAAVRDAVQIGTAGPTTDPSDDPTFDTTSWVADARGHLVAGPVVP